MIFATLCFEFGHENRAWSKLFLQPNIDPVYHYLSHSVFQNLNLFSFMNYTIIWKQFWIFMAFLILLVFSPKKSWIIAKKVKTSIKLPEIQIRLKTNPRICSHMNYAIIYLRDKPKINWKTSQTFRFSSQKELIP